MNRPLDRLGRPLGSLRISVTDRCNLRCRYCMPEAEYAWLPRSSLLSFEEIRRVAASFARLGVCKLRLTGGEPLLRQGLPELVAMLKEIAGIEEIALTTNGLLLGAHAAALREAGLDRITMSLDTLRPERMAEFARSAHHADAVAGLDAALAAGFGSLKLNSVVVRRFNDDEIVALVRFARERGVELRFIEYMDVGGATQWRPADVVSRAEILAILAGAFGGAEALPRHDDPRAPAERFRLGDGTVVGIVASTTAPFCRDCDRARITADGTFFRCLYGLDGIDLRDSVRGGATDEDLDRLLRDAWLDRSDRGAELRLGVPDRGVLVQLDGLRADPRREMHVRGG
ncbi:MAG: GTP 3',8-cyclase MoaA [Gemmatimonadota bacterium]